ncbi:hypothetical protein OF83DRAFT_1173001 [Amylostereum chailletii]|nr:hypothetical protein OF83DRAFT_1173001 [Amylostereum chailletii]
MSKIRPLFDPPPPEPTAPAHAASSYALPTMIPASRPRRVFGQDDSALTDADEDSPHPPRRAPGRISFSRLHRPWRGVAVGDIEDGEGPPSPAPSDRPPIPSALQSAGEASYTTPLPTLSMIVLSITLLGEFLTANVSMPFLLFMVEGFSEFANDDEADVGFWTGVLVSSFFLAQFLTSLLWATIADRHGARLVITISLLGGSLSCALFGTATSLKQAIAIRFAQGVFAGGIGVARGCVSVITDPSNEGRAYAILGFCWGFGGVAGAIVGGTFESPALKWPGTFAAAPLFVKYPYVLPTLMAASVTIIGAFLSLFVGPDGGPREGAIRLSHEKPNGEPNVPPTIPEEGSTTPTAPLSPTVPATKNLYGGLRRVSHRISGYFASRVRDAHGDIDTPPVALSLPSSTGVVPRRRTSRANGSAYGYGTARTASFRTRLASRGSTGSALRRRGSTAAGGGDGLPRSFGTDGADLNFAQRLLMANENAVTNIADLWVAAAMNVDNEEVFESEDEEDEMTNYGDVIGGMSDGEGVFDWEEEMRGVGEGSEPDARPGEGLEDTPTRRGRRSTFGPATRTSLFGSPRRPSGPSQALPPRSSQLRRVSRLSASDMPPFSTGGGGRRASGVPSIFAHPGVRTPPAVIEAQKLLEAEDVFTASASSAVPEGDEDPEAARPAGVMGQLPWLMIVQYGLLALHCTTHDMIFLSYLVSKYESGGLNLNAGHFSQLTALMCLFQIAYQFYLYPNIGPPRGRFSHLAMFRLGSVLFIPAYLGVTTLRVFASPDDDGNFVLMAALAVSQAIRYCGNTFTYTSVSILVNYMSPPPVVGLANGIAQSIVSLARCIGPILGGYPLSVLFLIMHANATHSPQIWSVSLEDNPSGFYIPFFIISGVTALAILHSAFIR